MKREYIKPEMKTLHLRLSSFITTSPIGNNNVNTSVSDENNEPWNGNGNVGEGGDNNDPNSDSRWMKRSIWDD